ncbi:uncharacterized protein LOC114741381 [Neltuma alba]|uniref:uncharacterized protein LOC114741381 n=1 Tax=Neltuma alba TaxID=207710 RepID=UPI0010A41970|nr:uncharacterized protein LOC114741381 [Prosopis alba]
MEENQITMKVKLRDKQELASSMDIIEEIVHEACDKNLNDIQWQLFNDDQVEEMDNDGEDKVTNNSPPSLRIEMCSDIQQPIGKTTPIFKDKLMGGAGTVIMDSNNLSDELNIEYKDVIVNMDGLIPTINFSERVKSYMLQSMRLAIVVKLLECYIRQDILYSKIASLWRPTRNFKLTGLDDGCYMVKFDNEWDYQNAMLGGPWVVLGHYLTVHPWEPTFPPLNLEKKQVYGWVRLPGLPYHYYHKSMLQAIGELIGTVLRIDYNTKGVDKARFAWLAVKIDLTKPLVSMIRLDGATQFVEYEGLPTICYHYGKYGHLEASCPAKSQQMKTREPTAEAHVGIPTSTTPRSSVIES